MTPTSQPDIGSIANEINAALREYSDKDWSYSRITLQLQPLNILTGPYALWIEVIKTDTKQGRSDFQTYSHEVTWGARHSNEIGILELISLRLNKALLEITTDEKWNNRRPAIRLVKKEDLIKSGITDALWYQVEEVAGEDFDNR